jgi:hypothetical protein
MAAPKVKALFHGKSRGTSDRLHPVQASLWTMAATRTRWCAVRTCRGRGGAGGGRLCGQTRPIDGAVALVFRPEGGDDAIHFSAPFVVSTVENWSANRAVLDGEAAIPGKPAPAAGHAVISIAPGPAGPAP